MTATSARARLPPPAIFTHDETLHAILLPPLAVFLSDLTTPEHLIKLHDILDRFRTPKSYHRIDVRLVESSELPPDAAAVAVGETAAAESQATVVTPQSTEVSLVKGVLGEAESAQTKDQTVSRKRKRDSGEPVVLPEGMGMEEYLLANTRHVDAEEENSASSQSAANAQPDGALNGTLPKRSDEPTLAAVADGFTPSLPTETPIPEHELPPAAPTRRVRELRLDLRTLDAAALFHLETWRREVLGLQRLDLEHPDSIWYKDPSPLFPSPPPVEPSRPKKRLGRPPKRRSTTRESAEVSLSQKLELEVQEKAGDYDALVEALASHQATVEQGITQDEPAKASAEPLPDANTINALKGLEEQGVVVSLGPPETEVVEEEGEPELDPIDLEPSRSPSSDVILDDLFDRREDKDPDFVPPSPEPQKPPRNRAKRTNGPLVPGDSHDSSEFGSLDDVIDPTVEPEAGFNGHETEAMQSIDLVPSHLVSHSPPITPPVVAIGQPVSRRKRKYVFEGVVLPPPRRRRLLPDRTSASASATPKKRKFVLGLSSPEKASAGMTGSRKSVRFDTPCNGSPRGSAGTAHIDGSIPPAAVFEEVGVKQEPEAMEEIELEEDGHDAPETEVAAGMVGGDDEWDFLKEL